LKDLLQMAIDSAEDKKALDLVTIDISKLSSFADHLLICSGRNKVQVKAIADAIEDCLAREERRPYSKQGAGEGEWIVLDYLDFVVHVFQPSFRELYQLERLWSRV